MANYKDLVLLTRLLCGMQGTGPSSVLSVQGTEEVLVRMVRDAYVDIQNQREEWNFLLVDKSFSLQTGQDTYTLTNIFGTPTPTLKKYKKDSFKITDSKITYLKYVDRDVLEARYLNDVQQKLPTQYAINPSNNALIFKPIPNGLYTVNFRYYRSPEILSTDTQIPILPLSFHNMIAYAAAAKMAVYLGSPELYQEYSQKAAGMLGQLMRMEIPKKRMRQRPMV
jgi:hypothetical protein